MTGNPPRSTFYQDVQSTFGTFLGSGIAASAERNLRSWGIDPSQLELLPQRGSNTRLYKLGDKLLVKLGVEIERYGQSQLKPMAPVLRDISSANVGFDMGDAPVTISVCPYLNTKNVTREHVQALCYEMQTQYGLLFRDNKLDNVGLADDGTPYIIDSGSLTEMATLRNGESAYLYPENSGGKGADHSYHWPELQSETPQFKPLYEQLATQRAAVARN